MRARFNSIWMEINMHFSAFLSLARCFSVAFRFLCFVVLIVVVAIGKNLNLMSIHYRLVLKGPKHAQASLINVIRLNVKLKINALTEYRHRMGGELSFNLCYRHEDTLLGVGNTFLFSVATLCALSCNVPLA